MVKYRDRPYRNTIKGILYYLLRVTEEQDMIDDILDELNMRKQDVVFDKETTVHVDIIR